MRLYEIEDINRGIIALKKLSENYENDFSEIYNALLMFRKLRGVRLSNFIELRVNPFKQELEDFLSTQFYDDPDIDKIKTRLSEMLSQLQ